MAAAEVASKFDPRLKDLYEIQFEIGQSRDTRNAESGIRTYINLERFSISKINPLNLSLCDEWEEFEYLDEETRKNNIPAVIFKMKPNAIALITMDFRTIMRSEVNWVYGEDWAVSITISKELTLDDLEDPVMLPEQFLHKDTPKNDIIEF